MHIDQLKQANLEIINQKREHQADNKDSRLLFSELKTGDTLGKDELIHRSIKDFARKE